MTMYSKEYKLKMLENFFMRTTRKDIKRKCPFLKVFHPESDNNYPILNLVPCSELCGEWPELGDVQSGCPCETLGASGAMQQLERLLIKEGCLDSAGEEV